MRLTARPSGPLKGRIRPPGDKSISHRSLILGALAEGVTEISGLLEGEDVLCTAAAMAAFGATVEKTGPGAWRVRGRGRAGFTEPIAPINFGNSGTGVRLTMGAAARFPISVFYVGDKSLSGRPMRRVLAPLEAMGVQSLCREGGRLPAAVRGQSPLRALSYDSPTASAQVKSAILLAGLGADGVTSVVEPHASRDHTERMLGAFGVSVVRESFPDGRHKASLAGGQALSGQSVAVPADPSSAAFAAAAAAIVPHSDVLLDDVCLNPLRVGFFDTLNEMAAETSLEATFALSGEPCAIVRTRNSGGLRGVAPPPARAAAMIDEFPILAAVAAFAEGETRLTGAEELRVKESDRIALMAAGLRACGVEVEELPDGLVIQGCGPGGVRGGAVIETHGDHRIAMSFLVLGLAAREPVTALDAEMIATSFPDFAGFMRGLGANIAEA
jgi:3-phosphoshikimate 1-carboxyvinyltransferase